MTQAQQQVYPFFFPSISRTQLQGELALYQSRESQYKVMETHEMEWKNEKQTLLSTIQQHEQSIHSFESKINSLTLLYGITISYLFKLESVKKTKRFNLFRQNLRTVLLLRRTRTMIC